MRLCRDISKRLFNGMPARKPINLYDTSYKAQFDPVHQEVREETYGLDLGQTSWMTAEELEEFIRLLVLTDSSHVLEVGCGAGGCAVHIAQRVGAKVTGIDVNEHGIASAKELADRNKVTSTLDFRAVDGSRDLPFGDESFDAVFSNDAMCHIPNRLQVLREWWRALKPGGRILFTDAMIVTGILSNEELAVRSAVGYYLFLPPGENERLIRAAGFELLQAIDLTGSVAAVASRWHDARVKRQRELIESEGQATFDVLQEFLSCVRRVSAEERLSRFAYLGRKSA